MIRDTRPRGIDVSQYNSTSFHGFAFVFIRATSADGGLHEDADYRAHLEQVRHAGIPFGVYHFAANGPTAKEQATFFADVVRKHRLARDTNHTLGQVIDLEGTLRPVIGQEVVDAAKDAFRGTPERRMGIYSGGWIKAIGGPTFGAHFGWCADWTGGAKGSLVRPAHWSNGFTRFWQYEVAGNPRLDRDLFRGTHAGLKRWMEDK